MKIILIGIQGSGKSTQGNLLSAKLGIPYLSTGHIFREMAKENTPLGKKVKEIMTAGLLQPDDLTVQVVEIRTRIYYGWLSAYGRTGGKVPEWR
jgi:adenylate kinase